MLRRTAPHPQLSLALTAAAIGLMTASAYFFRPDTNRQFIIPAALTFLLGTAAVGGALRFAHAPTSTVTSCSKARTDGRIRWIPLGLGVLLLAVVAESSGNAFRLPVVSTLSIHLQFAALLAAVLLVGWSVAGRMRLTPENIEISTLILLGAIIAVGLILRVWGLDITVRIMQDETIFSDAVRVFWDVEYPRLLNGNELVTITLVYPYWNAGTVELFGRNLVGLRLASALIGVMAIPAAYELGRILFNNRAFGLLAALLLATFPPHVHLSRISWGHMGDSLFGLMALMFIARGLKWNRGADWAFAGVSLGLTHYFYEVGRLLVIPLVVAWLALMLFRWNLRPYRRGMAIAAIAAVLIAAPVYYSLAVRAEPPLPRFNSSGMGIDDWMNIFSGGLTPDEQRNLTHRLITPFLVYTHHPDSLAEFYGGFAGFVSPVLVPLFLLGFALVVWRLPRPVFILALAPLTFSAANIFANDGGLAPRYVVVLPLIPMVMAVGLAGGLKLLRLGDLRWLLALLAVAVAAWQIYFYFGIHLPYYNEQRRQRSPERDVFDAVLRTPDLPPNTQVFLIDPAPALDYGRANGLYVFLQDPLYRLEAPTRDAFDPTRLPRDRNYAFFIARDDGDTFSRILLAFPDVQPPQYTPYPVPEWDQYMLLLWLNDETAQ